MNRADLEAKLAAIDWTALAGDLDAQGWTVLPRLVEPVDADAIAALYDVEEGFRSRVVMARHGFGQGEYRYFSYPLAPLIEALRSRLYVPLAPLA